MRDLTPLKRQTFVLCLVRQARVATRDHLVQMLIKRMAAIEAKAERDLDETRYQQRRTTERLVTVLREMLDQVQGDDPARLKAHLDQLLQARGGREKLRAECEAVLALRDDNHLPFMSRYFKPQRSTLFRLLHLLDVRTTSQDRSITEAIAFIAKHEAASSPTVPVTLDLAWASEPWRRFIEVSADGQLRHKKLALEMCVFSRLVEELKTGDLAVNGSEVFADFREQMLTWRQCQSRLDDFCEVSGLPRTAEDFVAQLKRELRERCALADRRLGEAPLKVGPNGDPVLPRLPALRPSRSFRAFEELVVSRLRERPLLDILWDIAHHTQFTRHFGPLSGSDPKLKEAADMYVVTNFAYGVNLGPTQTAKHLRGEYPAHKIAYVNRHHMTERQLDKALVDIVNETTRFPLIYLWGSGKRAVADGTHFATWERTWSASSTSATALMAGSAIFM